MKIFVQVESVNNIPSKFRRDLLVLNPNKWVEAIDFLESKNYLVYIYMPSSIDSDNFLKTIEDYKGDLVVYSSATVTPVFLSRFNRVVYRFTPNFEELMPETKLMRALNNLKVNLNDY